MDLHDCVKDSFEVVFDWGKQVVDLGGKRAAFDVDEGVGVKKVHELGWVDGGRHDDNFDFVFGLKKYFFEDGD